MQRSGHHAAWISGSTRTGARDTSGFHALDD
jgi:hypothetical protein